MSLDVYIRDDIARVLDALQNETGQEYVKFDSVRLAFGLDIKVDHTLPSDRMILIIPGEAPLCERIACIYKDEI